jgi:hypothetical protein
MGWVCSGGGNLAPGLLGLVAGDPDRHRGWLLCPSVPAAEAARVPGSWACAAAPSTCPGAGCNRRPSFLVGCLTFLDRRKPPPHAHFHFSLFTNTTTTTTRSGPAPIQTKTNGRSGCTAPPSGYMTSVDHTGLLRRPPRCSVITQRARMQQRPSQQPPPFLHVPPRALWLECGPVEKKKKACPTPAESHVCGCMHAGGEQRGHLAAPGRQMK